MVCMKIGKSRHKTHTHAHTMELSSWLSARERFILFSVKFDVAREMLKMSSNVKIGWEKWGGKQFPRFPFFFCNHVPSREVLNRNSHATDVAQHIF